MDNFNEAGRQFSQIMSAGKITEENLGVIKERLPAFAKLMCDTFGTSTAAGLKEAGVGVDEFVAKISAGMQKTKGVTDTAQNAFDNLQAAGTDALNSLGAILLPPVVKGVTAISDALSVASEGMTAFAASSTGKKLFGDLSAGFASFRDSAVNIGKAVGDALEKAGISVKSRDVQNAIKSIGEGFKAAGAAVERFTASAGFRNFVASVVTGAKAIVDGFRPVVVWFQSNMPLIRRTVETVVGFITQFWREHGQQIMAVVGPVYEQVKNAITTAVTVIGNVVKLVMQVVNGDWKDAGATARKIGENIVQYIGRTFTNLGSLLRGMVTLTISATNDILNRMSVAAAEIARTFWEGFKSALGDFWKRVASTLQTNFESAKSTFIGVGTSIGTTIADGIKAAISGGPSGLLSWFKGLLSDLWKDFQSFLAGSKTQPVPQVNQQVASFKPKSAQSRFTESYGAEGVLQPPTAKYANKIPKKTTTSLSFGTGGKTNFGTTDTSTADKAQKAIDDQMASLQKDVAGQRIKLRQITASNKSQLKAANISELGEKFDKLDFKNGGVQKLASDYLRLTQSVKDAEKAVSDKARASSALESLYQNLQTQVLLLRDSSVKNTVAVQVHGKAYKDLTADQKENLRGTIDLQNSQIRLVQSEQNLAKARDQAEKKAEERRAAQERLADSLKTASLNFRMFRASVEGLDDSANPMILALQQTEKSFFKLDLATQLNILSQALFNQKLLDGKGLEAHKKRITDLVNQYKSLTHAGSEWSKFLIVREGTDFEAGIDPEKLKRLREEFVALGNVEQAGGLQRLRDRIKEMKIAVGEIKYPTTEARIAYEDFGKKVEELSPEIAAEVRKTAREFDRLADKIKKIEMIKQVGQTIKDVFRSAFETVLTTGKGFFQALIDGFKRAIIAILAEKAAAAVASGAEDLLGQIFKTKKKDGEVDEKDANKGKGAGSTYSAMAMALENAKRTPTPVTILNAETVAAQVGAATGGNLAPILMQLQGGGFQIPGQGGFGGGAGMGAVGAKIATWAGSQLLGSAAGAATGGIYTIADTLTGGALTKGLGSAIKGIGKVFGFANGGVPPIGRASLVGERGAELFVPNQSGTIYTHEASRKILQGGGGGTVEQINYNGPITINDKADLARIKAWNREKTQKKLRLV